MAKVIAMSNHKGGVAKTTSVVNIGAGLSSGKAGKRVLLIDLDPQANLTHSLGIDKPERTIYGAMKGEYPITPIKVSDRLSVIASTLDLSSAEIDLSSEAGREFVLKELIQPLKKDHDYILIDCPPSLSLLTLNALVAADDVYIPMQTQYLALQGLTKLTDVIEKIQKRLNKKLNLGGIILTQYDSRKVLDRDISKAITNKFKSKVFNTKIRNTVALAEAPMKGVDIFRYAPKSNGAQDYSQLCKEIISRK
jgi:chromosome partitioning protein